NDLNVIGLKQDLENDIRTWYQVDEGLTRRFGHMFDEMERDYGRRFQYVRASGFFSETFIRGIELFRLANIFNGRAEGRADRQAAFLKDYDAAMDREVMAALLENYRKQVSAEFLPSIYKEIDTKFKGSYKDYAQWVYDNTVVTAPDAVEKFAADSLLAENDPAMQYAQSILDYARNSGTSELKAASENIEYNEHMLTQAILEYDMESPHYSDANFSMRLSYGYIQDYTSQGTHYDYYTTSQSLLDKAATQEQNPDYEFPDDIANLFKTKDFGRYADSRTGDLNLCFLSNNDITGGNSGSPMFNGKGEVIGLAFDGNWEAMSGDISFDNDLQRCIGVDIRYVLYIIDKWGKADNLIKELGL
ncbi:MAG: S46 family peptidase, partial [Bacteroidaceae bacterium]|nr:S46 family peptidase [Bacteroidaceae bacterium]